jgi:hypothetical protein
LLPILRGESSAPREIAVTGKFGDVIRVYDGRWALYLVPEEGSPLYWYGNREPGRIFAGRREGYDKEKERYPIHYPSASYENELYDLQNDPGETRNLAGKNDEVCFLLKRKFSDWLKALDAPAEVADRYGVNG